MNPSTSAGQVSAEQLKYQIALTLLPGIGPVGAKNLISYCGSIEAVFKSKQSQLEKIPNIGPERAKAIVNHEVFKQAEDEVRFIQKHKITTLFYLDADYPQRLKECDDSPMLLYFKGNCKLNAERMVAIVGTRNATSYGKQVTEKLVEGLGKYNVTFISGLAYGIDIIAHKAAVKNNLTNIGVLAHGLDRIYPAVHRPTVEKMVRNGGVLTEFTTKTNPDRENFPARNRIVAGMADAVIVVESGIKGGALITAKLANSYNRDVFAVPGRVSDGYSEGCNELIRINIAALLQSGDQFAEMMGWNPFDGKEKKKQLKIFREFNSDEKVLVDLLQSNGKLSIDSLATQTGIPVQKISSNLLTLEIEGVLRALPGKMFELN